MPNMKDMLIEYLEGRVEELQAKVSVLENFQVKLVSKITGTKPEPCEYGDPSCAGDISAEALAMMERVHKGEMKLYEVNDYDALKMTVEEGSELERELTNDLAMLLGVELKPCSSPCPGHLPKEAAEFLADLRSTNLRQAVKVKLFNRWNRESREMECACGNQWSQKLHAPWCPLFEAHKMNFRTPEGLAEPPATPVSEPDPWAEERRLYTKLRLISWLNREFREAGTEAPVQRPAMPDPLRLFDQSILYQAQREARQRQAGPVAPFNGSAPCVCLKPLSPGETWADMPIGRIAPHGMEGFSADRACHRCEGTGRRTPATPASEAVQRMELGREPSGGIYSKKDQLHPEALCDSIINAFPVAPRGGVQPQSEPEAVVGTTQAPEGPGEAAAALLEGIWKRRQARRTSLREIAPVRCCRHTTGIAKEAYEAGVNAGQVSGEIDERARWTGQGKAGSILISEKILNDCRLRFNAGNASLSDVIQDGYDAGRVDGILSLQRVREEKAAEESKLVTDLRERTSPEGWRPGIASAIAKLKGGYSGQEFIRLVWDDGHKQGVARGREIEQETQIGESIAREEMISRERIEASWGPWFPISEVKTLIEKVKSRGYRDGGWTADQHGARDAFRHELLRLLDGRDCDGEPVARKDYRLPRLGEPYIAFTKDLIEQVRANNDHLRTGILRCVCERCETRDDFANELLDLLDGKSLKKGGEQ